MELFEFYSNKKSDSSHEFIRAELNELNEYLKPYLWVLGFSLCTGIYTCRRRYLCLAVCGRWPSWPCCSLYRWTWVPDTWLDGWLQAGPCDLVLVSSLLVRRQFRHSLLQELHRRLLVGFSHRLLSPRIPIERLRGNILQYELLPSRFRVMYPKQCTLPWYK